MAALIVLMPILSTVACTDLENAVYKSGIEKAIHEDALTGNEPTYGHTAAMRKVDLSDCPQDFRVAYANHIHAWDERAAAHAAKVKLDNDEDASAVAGLLSTLFDIDATPWSDHVRAENEVKRLESIASNDVHTTWQDVETVASKYGAQLPH